MKCWFCDDEAGRLKAIVYEVHNTYEERHAYVLPVGEDKELVRHGYRISQGTLYPTLHQLEQLGYLRSRMDVIDGRRRKYYRATAAGRKVLALARQRLAELVSEIVEDNDQPFRTIHAKRHRRQTR